MTRFLSREQIDTERWDHCIDHSLNGNVYAYSWYLDLVSPGWCALVEDEYQRVMPLPAWKKMKIHYLSQPFFTQQLGIFSPQPTSSREVKEFIYKIPRRFRYIDINLNEFNKIETSAINYKYNVNYELSLQRPFEAIENHYSENLKRNIRKAARCNMHISKDVNPALVIDLFRNHRGKKIAALADPQYQLLANLFNALALNKKLEVWGAYNQHSQLLGGVVWAFSHDRAIFLFSAVSDEGRKLGTMPLLIDLFIRENCESKLLLDFEGSNDEKLGRFYAGFGAKKTFYPRVYLNYLPFYMRIGIQIYRRLRARMKK